MEVDEDVLILQMQVYFGKLFLGSVKKWQSKIQHYYQ